MMSRAKVRGFTVKLLTLALVLFLSVVALSPRVLAAACTAPATDYGSVTTTVSVPSTATYRIWSRMMVPDATNNTYLLQVDNNTCFNMGGSNISANTWTWVAHRDGNINSKADMSLTAGSHSLKLIGNKPDVKLDRLVLSSDLTCTPTGDGSNCNSSSDSTPPTVRITSPTTNASVSGTVNITATATDNTAVTKVEMYINSTLLGTDTTSPYSFSWDTNNVANNLQTLTAKGYDAAGNIGTDSFTVLVENGDKTPPSVPSSLTATAVAYNKINLSWKASTDNTGVTGYTVLRDTVPLTNVTGTTFTDTPVNANTTYTYQVLAYDAAGNKSASSSKVTVKTPDVADSVPPSTPTGVTATSPGPNQVNVSWTAATDNIGVVGYDVYRSSDGQAAQKVSTVTTTSFGDTNVAPATKYTYYVIAMDGHGNSSKPSDSASVTTQAIKKLSAITGTIKDAKTGHGIRHAAAVMLVGNNKHIIQANIEGKYTIRNLDAGRYNVSYRATRYQSQTFSIKVIEDTVITKDVTLQKR